MECIIPNLVRNIYISPAPNDTAASHGFHFVGVYEIPCLRFMRIRRVLHVVIFWPCPSPAQHYFGPSICSNPFDLQFRSQYTPMNFFAFISLFVTSLIVSSLAEDLKDSSARPVIPVPGNDNGWSIFMICENRNGVFNSALFRGSNTISYRINHDCLRTTLSAASPAGPNQSNHARKWPVDNESFPNLFSYFEYQFACKGGDRVHVQRRINAGAWSTIYSCDMNFDAHGVVFRPLNNPSIAVQIANERAA